MKKYGFRLNEQPAIPSRRACLCSACPVCGLCAVWGSRRVHATMRAAVPAWSVEPSGARSSVRL